MTKKQAGSLNKGDRLKASPWLKDSGLIANTAVFCSMCKDRNLFRIYVDGRKHTEVWHILFWRVE